MWTLAILEATVVLCAGPAWTAAKQCTVRAGATGTAGTAMAVPVFEVKN